MGSGGNAATMAAPQRRRRSKDIGMIPSEVQAELKTKFESLGSFGDGACSREDALNLIKAEAKNAPTDDQLKEMLEAVDGDTVNFESFVLLYATLHTQIHDRP